MSEIVSFITYTNGAVQYVTIEKWESQFLNWLNRVDDSVGYKRETHSSCGVRCAPFIVHATEKKDATVLKLVRQAPMPDHQLDAASHEAGSNPQILFPEKL